LFAPTGKKGKNQFQLLMDYLPDDHKAKWFAGGGTKHSRAIYVECYEYSFVKAQRFS